MTTTRIQTLWKEYAEKAEAQKVALAAIRPAQVALIDATNAVIFKDTPEAQKAYFLAAERRTYATFQLQRTQRAVDAVTYALLTARREAEEVIELTEAA